MRLPPAPPPPHLHRWHLLLCIPLQKDSSLQLGAGRVAAASASSPHPSPQHPLHPRKHPFLTSIPALLRLTPPLLSDLFPSASVCRTRQYPGSHILGWFTLLHPPLPFCSAGLATATVPLFRPLHHNPLSEARFRKKQASCLFFLQKCLLAGQLVFRCPSGR